MKPQLDGQLVQGEIVSKSALCGGKLDHFEVSALEPGKYTLEIVVEDAETGDMITKAGTPLIVH